QRAPGNIKHWKLVLPGKKILARTAFLNFSWHKIYAFLPTKTIIKTVKLSNLNLSFKGQKLCIHTVWNIKCPNVSASKNVIIVSIDNMIQLFLFSGLSNLM
ncbi:hypothetical protein, partial [Infirmifilum sp.]|uniref:hypothetical protein n=1 Tax=Infirmifilum sp. TaxID=2856575 RepID=UPI003D10CA1D